MDSIEEEYYDEIVALKAENECLRAELERLQGIVGDDDYKIIEAVLNPPEPGKES